jgi:hypothetical protein
MTPIAATRCASRAASPRRLFPDGSPMTALRLVDSKVTTTSVVIATYQPAQTPAAR